jgi:hypothetical protein
VPDEVRNTMNPLPDTFEVPPPSLADLLAGRPCAAWLRRHVQVLAAAPTLIEQAAAVGHVVRLWEPSRSERDAILMGKAGDPGETAEVWMRSLGASRKALAHLAIQRSARLSDAIATLGSDPNIEETMVLVCELNVLESVRALLSFSMEDIPLARVLADIEGTMWATFGPMACVWQV